MVAVDRNEFLSRLVDEQYDRILKYARVLTGREDDAAELAQETFLIATRHTRELTELDDPGAWLRRTLYHRWQHYVERSKRERDNRAGEPDDAAGLPDETSDPEEQVLTDMTLAATLTGDEYKLARLAFLDGLTLAQAAQELKISPAACRKRMERLRRKLRERYPL